MQIRVARYIFKIFSHPELNSKAVLKHRVSDAFFLAEKGTGKVKSYG